MKQGLQVVLSLVLCAACGSIAEHPDAAGSETLTIARDGMGSGTVTSTPAGISCGTTCSASFEQGSPVVLTAAPDAGSTFTGWSGGGCTGTGPCVTNLVAASSVTATFGVGQFALSVIKSGTGNGGVTSSPAGIDCGATCSAMFGASSMVTLTAAPTSGSSFVGWSGGGCKGIAPCTVPIAAATTVSATFGVPSLYLIRDDTMHLQRVTNFAAPVIVDVGPLGSTYAFGDCTWDYANNTFYVTEGRNTQSLYTVNLSTGATTLIGQHGITDMFALAWYPPTDTLYGVGVDSAGPSLYTIDKTTGAATRIGTVTGATNNNLNGMVFDTTRNQMLATSYGAPFNTIDLTTGTLTPIAGTTSVGDNSATTYDPVNDKVWQVNYSGGLLMRYDPATNYAATQMLATQGPHTCIAYVP